MMCDQIGVCLTVWVTCNVSEARSSSDVCPEVSDRWIIKADYASSSNVICKIVTYAGLYFNNHFDHTS